MIICGHFMVMISLRSFLIEHEEGISLDVNIGLKMVMIINLLKVLFLIVERTV